MSHQQHPNSARLFAPIALVACAIAFLFVLATSDTGGDDSERASGTTERTTTQGASTTERKAPARRATYSVKTGDTLGSISQKTGVSVENLQLLNPELDPQALVSGQKIKLRE